jgi:cytochrome c-type biogenesis protein CcmH/NrfG
LSLTFFLYLQVADYPFIGLDDDRYITDNHRVRSGLTLEGVRWAFTTTHMANWHPLAWMSFMTDVTLFGLDPGKHHMMSVALHTVNVLLLVFVLWRMTGCRWRSLAAASLLAVHPLHVESVAWAAERKDVLSAFFWWLTIWAYTRYTERQGIGRYIPIVLFFACGLMSKPMVVTLPFVLLLLDWWPLGRVSGAPGRERDGGSFRIRSLIPLVWEKAPLFAMSAAASVVTYLAQAGASAMWEGVAPGVRVGNAVISYSKYLLQAVWPTGLTIFYPHPMETLTWRAATVSIVFLAAATFWAWKTRYSTPWFAVGWAWYLGTLVPVIGFIQVGGQAMADRYTYLPMTGIFVALVWSAYDVASRMSRGRHLLAVVWVTAVSLLAVTTRTQVGYWKSGGTLFSRALEVTENNWQAHENLGWWLHKEGRMKEAVHQYREALRLEPGNSTANLHLGVAMGEQGYYREAESHFRRALDLYPENAPAHYNLGMVLSLTGRRKEAESHFREARRLKPESEFLRSRDRPR